MAFNPDQYIAEKSAPAAFDPDQYLAEKGANTPQWSDIPANALQGLKEAPQTAMGLANSVVTGQDLTNPASYVNSAVQALSGTPLTDTDTGKAVGAVTDGVSNTVDGIKNFVSNPGMFLKNQIIQHPIGTAANVAGLALGGAGLGEDALDTAGQYAGRFGDNQAIKALGGTRGQIGQIGVDDARALARRAGNEYGLLDSSMGPIGREQTVNAMQQQAGHEIGDIRDTASQTPAMSPGDVVAKIREQLGDQYSPSGVNHGSANQFEQELNSIQQMQNPTFKDYAERVSQMNEQASKNKMVQATGTQSDIANSLAHINDEGIKGAVPDMAGDYDQYKQTFQDMKNLGPQIEKGEIKDATGSRSMGMIDSVKKMAEDAGANKFAAKAGWGAESALNATSGAVRPMGFAATTTSIMQRLQTDPQSFGKYAAPLIQAQKTGGSQGVAATHFLLANTYPDYNELSQSDTGN